MLKIKDNLDLKELEKYGFIKNTLGQYIKQRNVHGAYCYTIYITPTHHYIQFKVYGECTIAGSLQNTLYDLIKDGLVDKVD